MFQFDWVNFINGLVQYGPAPPQITPADRIILTSTAYLNRLFPLLDKTAHRSVSLSLRVFVYLYLCQYLCL